MQFVRNFINVDFEAIKAVTSELGQWCSGFSSISFNLNSAKVSIMVGWLATCGGWYGELRTVSGIMMVDCVECVI